MAKNNDVSQAERYREERKARLAKAAKKNAKTKKAKNAAASVSKKIVIAVLCVAIAAGAIYGVIAGFNLIDRFTTVLKVGDYKVNAIEFGYFYYMQYNQKSQELQQLYEYYGQTFSTFDTSVAPEDQLVDESDKDNKDTWADTFAEGAANAVHQLITLYEEASKEGYKLTDDDKAEIDEYISSMKSEARNNNLSLNAYLRLNYGRGINEKFIRLQLKRSMIAETFATDRTEEFKNKYSDEDIKKIYDEDPSAHNVIDFRIISVPLNTLTAESGETSEQLEARQKKEDEKTKEKADKVFAAISDEKTFLEQATALHIESHEKGDEHKDDDYDAKTATLNKRTKKSNVEQSLNEESAKWMFDSARKTGEFKMFNDETNGYYIVMVQKPAYAQSSVDVRHIFIPFSEESETPTDEEKKTAKETMDSVQAEWKNGEKTEEAFAALAKKYSKDTNSSANGGLFEDLFGGDVYFGNIFNDWVFDPARKTGDDPVIEGDYGYHLLYFVKSDTKYFDWMRNILNTKGNEDYTAYQTELLKSEPYKLEKYPAKYARPIKKFSNWLADMVAQSNASAT